MTIRVHAGGAREPVAAAAPGDRYKWVALTKESFTGTGLPGPGLWRLAPLARVVPNLTRETLRRTVPGAAGRIDEAHRRYRREFLAKHLEGGEAKFTPVDKLTR